MRTILTPNATVRSTVLLVSRVILGIILVAHGYQKFAEWTLAGTTQAFAGMGVPLPAVSATFAAVVELVGGILLVVGAFTPIVGLLVFLDMLGAALLVHLSNGIFVGDGGWELVGAIGAGALALAATGAGRWSVDGILLNRTQQQPAGAPVRESVSVR
ncbi:putative oxidoreductase [Raineyella antarctica]|uniref:Putative oxidoreductase n=1 Tax=Raineyella antarctica TaxID=1577474 RepID=A0A1G6GDL9_9ACTN|nr:DoxX family protein [Raineyella antarctica]SDB80087.1 putative oxidoreductase [Raineyella antarctica]